MTLKFVLAVSPEDNVAAHLYKIWWFETRCGFSFSTDGLNCEEYYFVKIYPDLGGPNSTDNGSFLNLLGTVYS